MVRVSDSAPSPFWYYFLPGGLIMDKPAVVCLQIDKSSTVFWLGLFEHAAEKSVSELADSTLVALPVKNFSLADHQFLHATITADGGKEMQLWIPRSLVRMIGQGTTDMRAAFSFAGSKLK